VLADFGLAMGFLVTVGLVICFCLFFGHDIQTMLYSWSGGRFGKRPKTLLPTRDTGDDAAALDGDLGVASRHKKGKLPRGWAKVTVQTTLVNQKKDLEVAGCQSLAELRELIWDEFGHLLKGMRVKDSVLLVWASDLPAEDEVKRKPAAPASTTARWMQVTESSDIAKVVACGAIKLRDKKDVDIKGLAVAFAPVLTHKTASKGKNRRLIADKSGKTGTKHKDDEEEKEGEEEEEDDDEDDDGQEDDAEEEGEEADGGAVASALGKHGSGSRFHKNGGFQRLQAVSLDESDGDNDRDDDDFMPPVRQSSTDCAGSRAARALGAKGGGRGKSTDGGSEGRNANGAGKGKKKRPNRRASAIEPAEDDEDHAHESSMQDETNLAGVKHTAPSRAVVSDEEMEAPAAQKLASGQRVEVNGLVSKADLNGRRGTVVSFDVAKRRYRVRLDALLDGEPQVLAFKAENLQLASRSDTPESP